MKVNWDAPLKDLDGEVIKDGDKEAKLSSVACVALLSQLRGDDALSADKKVDMFKLALSATSGGVGEITTDQATLLKSRLAICYNALIVGRAVEIIEGGG